MNSMYDSLWLFNHIFGFFMLLLDASIKGALLLLASVLLCRSKKSFSSYTRYALLLVSICGMMALPFLFESVNALNIAPSKPMVVATDTLRKRLVPGEINLYQMHSDGNLVPLAENGAPRAGRNPTTYIPVIWAAGAALVVFRLLVGMYGIRRISKRACACGDREKGMVLELCGKLGIKRPVELRVSPAVSSPVTFGTFRPVILIPAGAEAWPDERMQVVLLHEACHIKRFDNFIQIMIKVLCALYWFNPLIWIAARRLAVEGENACDDCVLRYGILPHAYAGHLLDVVRSYYAPGNMKGYASYISGFSKIESRIAYILDTARKYSADPRKTAWMSVIAFGLALPLSFVNITAVFAAGAPEISYTDDGLVDITCKEVGIKIRGASPADVPVRWPLQNETGPGQPGSCKISRSNLNASPLEKGVYIEKGAVCTAIVAAADGEIEETGTDPEYGKYILIRHKNGFETFYGFVSELTPESHVPRFPVDKGDIIGYNWGFTRIYYEIRVDGQRVDTAAFLYKGAPAGENNRTGKEMQ